MMRTATELAVDANELLARYVAVHDAVFKNSLLGAIRRVLPIPVFFQAIRYDEHVSELELIGKGLDAILGEAQAAVADEGTPASEIAFLPALIQYLYALNETVALLETIFRKLLEKAQGRRGLSWDEYREALRVYDATCQRYIRHGKGLNVAFARLASSNPQR